MKLLKKIQMNHIDILDFIKRYVHNGDLMKKSLANGTSESLSFTFGDDLLKLCPLIKGQK